MNRKIITAALFSGLAFTFAAVAHADYEWQDHAKGADYEAVHDAAGMHKFIQQRLDKLAERLEIKASQQPAWEAYAQAVQSLADGMDKKDAKQEENGDAATLAHRHADRVEQRAKKLAAIADATDKLQAVLNENQRKVLAQETGRYGWRHGHMGRGGCEHRGHDMHD